MVWYKGQSMLQTCMKTLLVILKKPIKLHCWHWTQQTGSQTWVIFIISAFTLQCFRDFRHLSVKKKQIWLNWQHWTSHCTFFSFIISWIKSHVVNYSSSPKAPGIWKDTLSHRMMLLCVVIHTEIFLWNYRQLPTPELVFSAWVLLLHSVPCGRKCGQDISVSHRKSGWNGSKPILTLSGRSRMLILSLALLFKNILHVFSICL